MLTFIKAQASSLLASIFDFMTTIVSVQLFGVWYIAGSITGTIAGGWLNFTMGRRWVFKSGESKIYKQLIKYFIVWVGNLVLVTSGVFVLTRVVGLNYILSKLSVSLVVGSTYNYLMQKRFVFLTLHENSI